MRDLELDHKGDLKLNEKSGELSLIDGKDALGQRKQIEMSSAPGALVEAPWEGISFSRETTLNKLSLLDALGAFEKAFLEDEEIDPQSVHITAREENGVHRFYASFKTKEEEQAVLSV